MTLLAFREIWKISTLIFLIAMIGLIAFVIFLVIRTLINNKKRKNGTKLSPVLILVGLFMSTSCQDNNAVKPVNDELTNFMTEYHLKFSNVTEPRISGGRTAQGRPTPFVFSSIADAKIFFDYVQRRTKRDTKAILKLVAKNLSGAALDTANKIIARPIIVPQKISPPKGGRIAENTTPQNITELDNWQQYWDFLSYLNVQISFNNETGSIESLNSYTSGLQVAYEYEQIGWTQTQYYDGAYWFNVTYKETYYVDIIGFTVSYEVVTEAQGFYDSGTGSGYVYSPE